MNYVQAAIPFFILAMGVEFLYGKFVDRQTYRLNDTVNSLSLGVLSAYSTASALAVAFAHVLPDPNVETA